MKLWTFSAVATAGMIFTSAAAWSLATPGQASASSEKAWQAKTQLAPQPESKVPSVGQLLGFGPKDHFDIGKTLRVEGRLGHATLAAGRSAETFVHLDVTTDTDLETVGSAPLNLAIVLDRSRSMEGQRMENALAAARGMIGRLRDGDTVSVVAYNTSTTTLVQPTTISPSSRTDVLLGLRDIEAAGHTCISCGVEAGLELLERRTGAINRMLLLSDGEANAGVRDEEGFRRIAEAASAREASVSSIGVDVDYNERLMLAVAQGSNGRHYFVESPGSLSRIFDEELSSLLTTVASGAEVTVDLAPGVELVELFDRSFRREGNHLIIPMGTFAKGEEKSVLMRVRTARAEPGDREIATVALRFNDLSTGEIGTCDGELIAEVTGDARRVAALDPVVETRLARAETLAALGLANREFASGDAEAAERTLGETRTRIRDRATRSAAAAPAAAKAKVSRSFDQQFEALDGAEKGFGKAQADNPFDSANSQAGRASVRQNASAFDELGL